MRKLLNTHDVASLLGVSERTLEGWRVRGACGPPFIRIGRRGVRYAQDAVEEYLRRNERDVSTMEVADRARATA